MTRRSVSALAFAAMTYAAIGVVFAAMPAVAGIGGKPLRWVAWLASAVVFLSHIAFEQANDDVRSRTSVIALRVAVAVGLGAFAVAASANIRHSGPDGSPRLGLALIIWPLAGATVSWPPALLISQWFARRPLQSR